MKYLFISTFLTLTMLCSIACQRGRERVNGNGNNEPPSFSSAAEAANKAKSDLLAVLQSDTKINLGVDRAMLEKSQPATPIKHYQVTFQKLLAPDSAASFGNLAENEMTTIVPLVADNSVVTIAGVAKDDKGWKVAALADKSIADDLNALQVARGDMPQGEITIYELPNSAVKVYGVKTNDSEMFHTDYPGFNIHEGVPAERLLSVLRRDAAEFQNKYGAALKEQKLVR
jgi:hypothetical protein